MGTLVREVQWILSGPMFSVLAPTLDVPLFISRVSSVHSTPH